MAIKITLESFLAVLRRSNLVEAEQIKRLTDDFRAANGEPPDAKPFADYLVQQKQITAWQAEKLLMGKHKGFFLGRYKLKGLLGKGGMSSVYLAEHVLMRRMCALKVLPARRVNDASYLGRFHREAQAVAALDHPNIVRAYDVDHEEDGEFQIHFLVMEYVDGKSLLDLVTERGPARPTDAADWIRQAALGLEHAHRAGIIHRDIKPGNLLLDNGGTIKLLDMGLARFFGGDDEKSLTIQHDEKVLGTADYLAPEQAVDSHKVDCRADIYSLGCSLYFLLTGHPPFNTGTLAQRLMAHQMKEPPDVAAKRSDVPDSLLAIMKKMMAKLPEQRYPTAADASEALEAWLESQGVAAAGLSESGRMRKLEDPETIRTAPALAATTQAPATAPVPTPTPAPAVKAPATPKSSPPAPVDDEGFAALGDLFGQGARESAAPTAAAEPAAPSPRPPSAPIDDDVPAFLRGGAAAVESAGGFPDLFNSTSGPAPSPPVAPAPRPPATQRPAAKSPAPVPPKQASPKVSPPKGAPNPVPANSPSRPAPSTAGGDDVPDFLRMGGSGPAQADELPNPFSDIAGTPPAAPPPSAPRKAPAVAQSAPPKPTAKAPAKAKPASPSPPVAASAAPPLAAPPSPGTDDVPDFLRGDAGGGAGSSAGSGGFADLFSDGPASPSPTPPPAKPAPRPAVTKPATKPAPSLDASVSATSVPVPDVAESLPGFLTGGGEISAPIGDLFSNGFEDPSPAPAELPAAAKTPPVAATKVTTPAPAPPPADDVPDFLNLGAATESVPAGGMPDLFGQTVAAPQAAPPAPPPSPKKTPPASPAKAAAKAPAKAPPSPVAESDVPDFLRGGAAPSGGDGGLPDFLAESSGPADPPSAPAKAPPRPSPPKAAAPSKPAAPAPPVPASTVPAPSAVTAPPTAASPPSIPQETVPPFLADGGSSESPGGGTDDLFGIGTEEAAEATLVVPPASPALDDSSDSPFGETIMAEPADDAPGPLDSTPGSPFGQSDEAAVPTTAAPRKSAAAARKPGGADFAAAGAAWLKVRRNQMIAGGGAALLLGIVLAIVFWPKGAKAPSTPGSPKVAAGIPSAAAAKGPAARPKPQGETYTVGPTGNFGTVTEAVNYFLKNAPADGSRRTIKVTGGYWYGEAIAVTGIGLTSPLTITSDAASPAVLRPAGGKLILNVPMANGLVLENLVLDSSGLQGCAQVEAFQADCRLTNVEFKNFREFGLLTESVSAEDATKPVVIESCRFVGGDPGAKGVLVKTSTSTVFGLTVRQSSFEAPMRTGIEFGAGALGNVTVSQCRFVDVKTGLYFPPAKQDIADLLLLNNTFYRVNEGVVFNQAPAGSSQGMKSAVIGNLFVAPSAPAAGSPGGAAASAGGDFVIRAGLTTQSWDAFIKGGPGVAGNMTGRGGNVGAREVDIFSTGGGRRGATDLTFESVVPGTAGFLKPTSAVSFPPAKMGEPYAGAVAP